MLKLILTKKKINPIKFILLLIFPISGVIIINDSYANKYNTLNSGGLKTSTIGWPKPEIVSTESNRESQWPSITIDNIGNIHVVWHDLTDYNGAGADCDIFYKYWDNTTKKWTMTEVISTVSVNTSRGASIKADDEGNLYVIWCDDTNYNGAGTDDDIFFRYWNASSNSWSTIEVVSTGLSDYSWDPSIDVDSKGNCHVVWYDKTDYNGAGTDWDIFYRRWNATTKTWGTIEIVSDGMSGDSMQPSISVDDKGNAHVVWRDRTNYGGSDTDADIFYRFWNASTKTWSTIEVASTESTEYSYNPAIDTDNNGTVYIAWEDETDYNGAGMDNDIFYKIRNSTTKTWSNVEVISTVSMNNSWDPTIAVDKKGNVHIAWDDESEYDGSQGDYNIFYRFWNASTKTWSSVELVSTVNTKIAEKPSIAVDNNCDVYLVWQDQTDYNGAGWDTDIFFSKRGIIIEEEEKEAEEEEEESPQGILGYNILIIISIIGVLTIFLTKKDFKKN
ncbi:MAG: hypothetical protein ACP6IY_12380 [Promethearchaeia archaeon]